MYNLVGWSAISRCWLKKYVKDFLRENRVVIRKKLGQSFLVDCRVARYVADFIEGGVVYEIGCGIGNLTFFLAEKAEYVLGVELDYRLAHYFRKKVGLENVDVINSDAILLRFNGPFDYVVSNVPYYISSDIIVKLCKDIDFKIGILTFQKEFAERLYAIPGTSSYGRISVIASLCFTVKPLMTIGSSAFFPRPKVNSKILFIEKKNIEKEIIEGVEKLTQKIFSYRKRKLSFALEKGLGLKKEEICFLGDLINRRIFTLSPEEILYIYKRLREKGLF